MFEDILAKHGFDTKGVEGKFSHEILYSRSTVIGVQFISIQYESRYRGEFNISILFWMSCECVHTIIRQFLVDGEDITFRLDFPNGVLGLGKRDTLLVNQHHVHAMLNAIKLR
jgi:hypothetical protein